METQKIVNILNGSDNENSKFVTKKWYIIDSESNSNYSHHNLITFLTKSIESSLCDYYDAYTLVTGNIVTDGDNNTKVAFKTCAPFEKCSTEIDGTSLWNFKRDEIINNADVTNNDNAPSFKYKANIIGDTVVDGANRKNEVIKIVVPLKYSSNFWRSL